MTKVKYDRYVWEYVDIRGVTRFAVAEWNQEQAEYRRPLSKSTQKLTGCYAEQSKTVSWFGGWLTRRQALREARYLFGEVTK